MSQEERNEEAALVLEFEDMRARGASLQEIGRSRAKESSGLTVEAGKHPGESSDVLRKEKSEVGVQHVEGAALER